MEGGCALLTVITAFVEYCAVPVRLSVVTPFTNDAGGQ